jgi:hypothetical protein
MFNINFLFLSLVLPLRFLFSKENQIAKNKELVINAKTDLYSSSKFGKTVIHFSL